MKAGLALATALVTATPAVSAALEPRFDHRDTQGVLADVRIMRDTVSIPGRPSESSWHPALRIGYGFDAFGEGNDLVLDVETALRSYDDPGRDLVLVSADARYRAYVGTDELKTFFEFGVWAPLRSRLAVGPLVGVGVVYDFSRWIGIFAGGAFSTAFGQARVTSFAASAGAHFRFPL